MYSEASIMFRTEMWDLENFEIAPPRESSIKTNFHTDSEITNNEDLFNMSGIESDLGVLGRNSIPRNGFDKEQEMHDNYYESQNIYTNLIKSMLPCCLT